MGEELGPRSLTVLTGRWAGQIRTKRGPKERERTLLVAEQKARRGFATWLCNSQGLSLSAPACSAAACTYSAGRRWSSSSPLSRAAPYSYPTFLTADTHPPSSSRPPCSPSAASPKSPKKTTTGLRSSAPRPLSRSCLPRGYHGPAISSTSPSCPRMPPRRGARRRRPSPRML